MDYGRRLDGRAAIGLDIFKERNANLVDVSKRALAEVEAIREDPSLSDVQIKIIDNQGENVTNSLTELADHLEAAPSEGLGSWVMLVPLPAEQYDVTTRIRDLAKDGLTEARDAAQRKP